MFWLLNLIGLAAIGSNLAAGDGAGGGESQNTLLGSRETAGSFAKVRG